MVVKDLTDNVKKEYRKAKVSAKRAQGIRTIPRTKFEGKNFIQVIDKDFDLRGKRLEMPMKKKRKTMTKRRKSTTRRKKKR